MRKERILIILIPIATVILAVLGSLYAPVILILLFAIALTAAFGYGTWILLTWIQAYILNRMFPNMDEDTPPLPYPYRHDDKV